MDTRLTSDANEVTKSFAACYVRIVTGSEHRVPEATDAAKGGEKSKS